MPLVNCRECKKEVSTEAKVCPSCGVKKPQPKAKDMGIGSIFLVLLAGSCVAGPMLISHQKANDAAEEAAALTPAQLAAKDAAKKAQAEKSLKRTSAIAGTLTSMKAALRNPDSAIWEEMRANDDGSIVCLKYRAQNGFGGVNRESVAVVKGRISKSADVWNKNCAQSLEVVDADWYSKRL